MKLDLGNLQANIFRGSKEWRAACYVFYTVRDRRAAADALERLCDQLVLHGFERAVAGIC